MHRAKWRPTPSSWPSWSTPAASTWRSRGCPTRPAWPRGPGRPRPGRPLTRPELAVLLAYGKLELKREIVASDAPDDPFFERLLEAYFPKPMRKWAEPMRRHRLRRDIIATVV